jgi:hypothetical protein
MKFLAACWSCRKLDDRKNTGQPVQELIDAEITADFTCTLLCPRGHSERWAIANPHFEVLFDMGALAILDGYYREAISAFAASVERFQEFYIRAVCLFRELDDKAGPAAQKLIQTPLGN